MKIRILDNIPQPHKHGDIVDACVSYDKSCALFFIEGTASSWFLQAGAFQIVHEEEPLMKKEDHKRLTLITMRELIGQDIKSIEFK